MAYKPRPFSWGKNVNVSFEVTFWKNVSGVYTADPRQVPEAFPIQSMSLGENPKKTRGKHGSHHTFDVELIGQRCFNKSHLIELRIP